MRFSARTGGKWAVTLPAPSLSTCAGLMKPPRANWMSENVVAAAAGRTTGQASCSSSVAWEIRNAGPLQGRPPAHDYALQILCVHLSYSLRYPLSLAGPRPARQARAASLAALACSAAVNLELPEGVAVPGRPLGAIHPDVAAAAADRDGLHASGADGGGVDGRPGRPVVGRLDLEGLGVGGLPVQDDLADDMGGSEVDLQPLRVAGGARPASRQVPIDGIRCWVPGLHRRCGGRLPLGQQGA